MSDIALRDYFAARAMQAMITKSDGQMCSIAGKQGVRNIAKFAYEYADAMLEERERFAQTCQLPISPQEQ